MAYPNFLPPLPELTYQPSEDDLVFELPSPPINDEDQIVAKIASTMILQPPSPEQEAIIQAIAGIGIQTIIVDAVAGSGKTTTVLWLAKRYPDRMFIQVTYNAQLKIEVRAKAVAMKLTNLKIYTYHALAVEHYCHLAHEDSGLHRVISDNKPLKKHSGCDVLVIDETQDMTLKYFQLLRKFVRDIGARPTMVVLGDHYQGVYGFKKADTRYLSLAGPIWNRPDAMKLRLQKSYRVTRQIADFVNQVMIGEPRILADKEGPPVEYFRDSTYNLHKRLMKRIKFLIAREGILAEDIFVLAPSVKGSSAKGGKETPLQGLENLFVEKGILCYASTDDSRKLNADSISGKAVFSTFHQAKGRERKVVVVYGFDSSYFKYYARDLGQAECPSTLYVAATRSMKHLFILESTSASPLPFLRKTHDQMKQMPSIKFVDTPFRGQVRAIVQDETEHQTSATELVKFLKEDILEQVTDTVESLFSLEVKSETEVMIPGSVNGQIPINGVNGIVNTKTTVEEIAHINGLMVTTMYESRTSADGGCSVMSYISHQIPHLPPGEFLSKAIAKIPNPCRTPSDYLYLTTVYDAIRSGFHHKIAQIADYSWFTAVMVDGCHQIMHKHLPAQLNYEYSLGINTAGKGYVYIHNFVYNREVEGVVSEVRSKIIIRAVVDAVDPATVWEFKCVDSFVIDHYLQVIVYAWLWEKSMKSRFGGRNFRLMNVRTGEIRLLKLDIDLIDLVVQLLCKNKYQPVPVLSEAQFIEACRAPC